MGFVADHATGPANTARIELEALGGGSWCESRRQARICECGFNCPSELRCAGMVVWDTQTDAWGRLDGPLPLNLNMPSLALAPESETVSEDGSVVRATLVVMGGEANPGYVDGDFFGVHPALALRADISISITDFSAAASAAAAAVDAIAIADGSPRPHRAQGTCGADGEGFAACHQRGEVCIEGWNGRRFHCALDVPSAHSPMHASSLPGRSSRLSKLLARGRMKSDPRVDEYVAGVALDGGGS